MSRSADRRTERKSREQPTMGAVAAETNSSLPATALLSAVTAATPPPAAIKTSTCGGPAAFGGGLLLCSLRLLRRGSEGAGFLSGFISCEQGAISQRKRGRKRWQLGHHGETHIVPLHPLPLPLFLINPNHDPRARSAASSGAGNGRTAGNNKHFSAAIVSVVTDKLGVWISYRLL